MSSSETDVRCPTNGRSILGTIALEPNRWTGRRNPHFTLLSLLEPIRAAGFDKLEIWQWHLARLFLFEVREIRTKADDLGVSFPYIGVYPSFTLEGLEAREEERILADTLDKAELLGTQRLKIMLAAGLKGGQATPAQVQCVADRFGSWFQAARSRGIAVCVELHGNTIFDPVDAGLAFMKQFPQFDFSICFQPYDFADTAKAKALAARFAGYITHIHLQAPNPKCHGEYSLLEEGSLDYRELLPFILKDNPGATMTLEFVKHCIQTETCFDLVRVLDSARRDAMFIEKLLGCL